MNAKRTSGNSLMTDGFISFVVGIVLFFLTGVSQSFIVFAFGTYAIILGISQMIASGGERNEGESSSYLTILGIYSVLSGIALMFFVYTSLTTIITLIATYVVVTGIAEMAAAFSYRTEMGGYAWFVSAGITRILFGVFLFMNTGITLSTFVLAFAFYALVEGIAMSVFGYDVRYQIGKHTQVTMM